MSVPETHTFAPLLPQLDTDRVTRLYMATALFMLASFVIYTPGWLMETRILDSANPWTKPQKFNISLGLHFLTLAVLGQILPREVRTGWVMVIAAWLACASLVFEWVYMAVQTARGVRSHFNMNTPLEQLLYAGMGVAAVLMIAAALVLAIQLWRKGDRSRPGLLWGAVMGLIFGFILTMWLAGNMSATSRYVGSGLEGGGATVPFFGWSREYGDLRPAHFVSMHLMQTLPLAGWLADRRGWNWKLVVGAVAFGQIALALGLYFQAMAGKPFWPV